MTCVHRTWPGWGLTALLAALLAAGCPTDEPTDDDTAAADDDDTTADDDDTTADDDDTTADDDDTATDDDDTATDDDDTATDDDTADLVDDDGDGWTADEDCDDADPAIHPHAIEVPLDGTDQDCDGLDLCADLNCDGYTDLLFVNQHGDSTIYWGDAAGYSAASLTALTTTDNSYDATIGDLDGDGYLDIVMSEYCPLDQCFYDTPIFWGQAGGTFSQTTLPSVGTRDNEIADLDGDGYVDIVLSSHYDIATNHLDAYVYWGSANGHSPADRAALPVVGAEDSCAADLDGDGYLELVFANYSGDGGDYQVGSYLYWGSASGYDPGAAVILPTTAPMGCDVADLDADGYAEILFAGSHDGVGGSTVDSPIYWGDASWTFGATTGVEGTGTQEVIAADLDADGNLDLVVAAMGAWEDWERESWIYWGPSFDLAARTGLETVGAMDVLVADLDGDDALDIVFANNRRNDLGYDNDSYVYWGPTFTARTDLPTYSAFAVAAAGPRVDLPRTTP